MRHFTALLTLILSATFLPISRAAAFTLVWPTPSTAFSEGKSIDAFIQPTIEGGDPLSGTFGGVRNNGTRFHEGMDIRPVLPRNRKGEPTDPVFAAIDGIVAHVSANPGKSNYGRYIVVVHNRDGVEFYTLYAHLAAVEPGICPGTTVSAGTRLGTMGRSAAGYVITRERAHLHFEIGLKYGDNFQGWYNRQKFGSPNYQGLYNGMNLEGFDPLAFFNDYRAGKVSDMAAYIRSLPAAYMLRVNIADIPALAEECPGLLHRSIPENGLVGWDITFTWYGLPILLTPLTASDLTGSDAPGIVRLKAVNRTLLSGNQCKDTVKLKNGKPVVYSGTFDILEMMFGRAIPTKVR